MITRIKKLRRFFAFFPWFQWREWVPWSWLERTDTDPAFCWAELVGWRMEVLPYERTWADTRQGDRCREESAETGSCYCGKFKDGGLRP